MTGHIHHGPERPATVYRFYDEHGSLLYVGCTTIGLARWTTHAAEKSWWPLVACAHTEHFASNYDAVAEERKAVQTENPRFNAQGRRGRGNYRKSWEPPESIEGDLGERMADLRRRQQEMAVERWELVREAEAAGHSGEAIAAALGAHLADVQRVWHFQGPMAYR